MRISHCETEGGGWGSGWGHCDRRRVENSLTAPLEMWAWRCCQQCGEGASRSMLTWRCSALNFCRTSGLCFKKRSSKAVVEATVSWAANSRVRQLPCSRHKPPQKGCLVISLRMYQPSGSSHLSKLCWVCLVSCFAARVETHVKHASRLQSKLP